MTVVIYVVLGLIGLVTGWCLNRVVQRSLAVSARPGVLELLVAGAAVGVALRFGWSWTLPGEQALVAGMAALAVCDYRQLLLPKRIVWPTTLVVGACLLAAAAAQGQWVRLGVAATCATVQFAVFGAINLWNPRWLGFGDVRLAPLLGAGLGWVGPQVALVGFLLANVVGVVVGGLLIATRRTDRHSQLPFGVFLAAGAGLALLGGHGVLGDVLGP